MGRTLWLLCIGSVFSSGLYAQITWEINNRFPLVSERAFRAIVQEVATEKTDIEAKLTQVDFRKSIKHLDGSSAWRAKNQSYDKAQLLSPMANLRARSELGPEECSWTLTNNATAAQVLMVGPCDTSPSIPVEIGQTYELTAQRTSDLQSLSTQVAPRRWLVVALGDSFASGEGNPDYPAVVKKAFKEQPPHDWGVDSKYPANSIIKASAEWLDTDCHRSLLSWPALYALRKALIQTDTVVQFASFACSGAEILDGFLLPQRNPPGRMGPDVGGSDSHLEKSQQRMMAELLCSGQQLTSTTKDFEIELTPYLEKYKTRYAKGVLWRCSEPVRPDEVLIQFGGNDAQFAGIVKYVFQPPPLPYRGLTGWFVGSGVNFGIYKAIAPTSPQQAQEFIDLLPRAYAWLDQGLKALYIESSKVPVRMLQYPDPTLSDLPESEHAGELASCNLRTRDANQPVQSLIAGQLRILRHGSAFSGISATRLVDVRNNYIPTLRAAQTSASNEHKWALVDASPIFLGRGLCAGSLECDRAGRECSNGDRVRWNYWQSKSKFVASKLSPAWDQMSDFAAYDLERKRGMRYANDALLSSARLAPGGKRLLLDWSAGIAHPTAPMHARIAASLAISPLRLADN
jgi:hypothetical protein